MHNRYAFIAGNSGPWRVLSMSTVRGVALAPAANLDLVPAPVPVDAPAGGWALHGLTSNVRYATRPEITALRAIQQPLGRPSAKRAALIPLKKSPAWWDLAQDERRAIFEEQSHHTAIGLEYLPQVARKLYHCRDIGGAFDFLTWFEYAPEHAEAFEHLVQRLRETREWTYVDREVDIRLSR